jgi:hypothetical protein
MEFDFGVESLWGVDLLDYRSQRDAFVCGMYGGDGADGVESTLVW